VPLKRLLKVVQLTLYLFDVLKTFGISCLLRSASANAIRALVVGLDMFNSVVVDGQLTKKGWSSHGTGRLAYVAQ
jgi:hypothetical protein